MEIRNQSWRAGTAVALTSLMLLGHSAWARVNFSDVPASFWANQYIDYLSGRNVITGYPDNTFRPARPVTRAEFAVMLAKSQGLQVGKNGSHSFRDVPSSHWAASAIRTVADHGLIAGYPGGRFMPNQNISMAEMYTILAKASGQSLVSPTEADTLIRNYQDSFAVPDWAKQPVGTAIKNGIIVTELSNTNLFPTTQATRASIATALAKLVNPTYRDTSIAKQPPAQQQAQGEAVDVTGTLQATAMSGEWVVLAPDGKRYFFTNPDLALTQQSWFRVGQQVQLKGNLDTAASTTQRPVVKISTLTSTAPQNQVTISGTLRPSTTTANGWVLQTSDNKLYRILNPETFSSTQLFRFGSNISVTGALRPDVTVPAADGLAFVASKVEASQASSQVAVTGILQPTVEAGGWTVQVPATSSTTAQKYVLLDAGTAQGQPWFKSGTEVIVKGTVRSDVPSIYQEGPVLMVSSIEPSPTASTAAQQVSLYFPNLLNITRDPATLLGNPTMRTLQGPSVPQKAIQAILQGPNDVERLRGFFVDDDIKKLTLDQFALSSDGHATVVLEAPSNFQFKNNVTTTRLDEQISRTLTQFTGIKDVSVSVKAPDNTVIWTSP